MSSAQEELSSWMNSDLIKTILTKFEGHDKIELNDFHVKAGASQGDNFAGVIKRLEVNYLSKNSKKSLTFIVKSSPTAGAVSELLEDLGVFDREVYTYERIQKDSEDLLPGFKMAPRLIYADKNAMVLEDLNSLNFELANRRERFDLKRAKLVIEKLAKFHAISIVLYAKEPSLMDSYKASAVDGDEMTPLTFFFSASMQETLETIRNSPDLQQFLPQLEQYDIVAEEKRVFSRNETDRLHVLNHGDLWINNIFFKYNDKGEPVDTLLVDYQESYWGSPGLDLNHFLYTSCNYDVHDKHFDELIKFYHEHLATTLKQLNFDKIPSIEDIFYEVRNKAHQGLIVLCSIVAVMMIENPEHANPENFLSDGEEAQNIRREVYGNPRFIATLKEMLPKIIARGVLSQNTKAESHF